MEKQERNEAENRTITKMAQHWLQNKKMQVKEATYVKYYNILNNHIMEEFSDIQCTAVTTNVMEAYIEQKLTSGKRDGRPLAEKTVKDIVSVLKDISAFALRHNIEIPCRFDLIKIRVPSSQINILSVKDEQKIKAYLQQSDVEYLCATGILLSMYMGLRLGEVCALKKQNILLDIGVLQVRSTMQRIQDISPNRIHKTKIIITEPKSRSSIRDIPIPDFLTQRLKHFHKMTDDTYILTGSPNYYIEPRTLENILKKYMRECGIQEINYHTLRHTFATRCIEAGFDAKTLSEILGHSSVNITLNRYVHSSMERKRKCMMELC
ncbi:MAG: tyrosine-type recombinase/integrase [Hespellia sp.]|nr:tyrosine-type recombinase/integrase [Hespellia sp.]